MIGISIHSFNRKFHWDMFYEVSIFLQATNITKEVSQYKLLRYTMYNTAFIMKITYSYRLLILLQVFSLHTPSTHTQHLSNDDLTNTYSGLYPFACELQITVKIHS